MTTLDDLRREWPDAEWHELSSRHPIVGGNPEGHSVVLLTRYDGSCEASIAWDGGRLTEDVEARSAVDAVRGALALAKQKEG
jgi:hypothetical protein